MSAQYEVPYINTSHPIEAINQETNKTGEKKGKEKAKKALWQRNVMLVLRPAVSAQ